jgi:hypothetical protein
MVQLKGRKMVTIEPILQFDIEELTSMIKAIKPEWINIGADSQRNGLPEPTKEEVLELADKEAEEYIKEKEMQAKEEVKEMKCTYDDVSEEWKEKGLEFAIRFRNIEIPKRKDGTVDLEKIKDILLDHFLTYGVALLAMQCSFPFDDEGLDHEHIEALGSTIYFHLCSPINRQS